MVTNHINELSILIIVDVIYEGESHVILSLIKASTLVRSLLFDH